MVSATGPLRTEGFPYALDNGAWTAYQAGTTIDLGLFVRALWRLGRDAEWVALPDIVAGGMRSLDLSRRWVRLVLSMTARALIPVQDGMTTADVKDLVSPQVGIFVGGDPRTTWKQVSTPMWAALCRARGAWCHVGRVNSARRIAMCAAEGATSFDGTSASRYAKTIPSLDAARRQRQLFDPGA